MDGGIMVADLSQNAIKDLEGRKAMKKIAVLACATMLVGVFGCAFGTKPIPTSEALMVPDKRIHDKQLVTSKTGFGTVVVKRDSGIMGAICNVEVFVDGNLSAELASKEKIIFYLSEGSHMLGVLPSPACRGALIEIEARVTKDRPLTFRIGWSNADYFINQTSYE